MENWIGGVGNEVVVGGGILSVFAGLAAAYLLSTRSRRDVTLHPEQENTVIATRMELARRDGEQRGSVGGSAELESCPICLMSLTFPVDTNCGHTFCAQCILSYWQHDQWPQAARCAVCRSQVTLLLPCAALSSQDPDLWRNVVDYNRRMSGEPQSLLQYISDMPVIAGHVWRLLFTMQGIVLLCRLHILLLLLLLILYLLSPLDLIPEALFGVLGLLDDFIILVSVVSYASVLYRHYITQN